MSETEGDGGSGFRRPAVSWFSDCYKKTSSRVTKFTPTFAPFGDFTHVSSFTMHVCHVFMTHIMLNPQTLHRSSDIIVT